MSEPPLRLLPNHNRVAAAVAQHRKAANQHPATYDPAHWGNWFNGGVGSVPAVWAAASRFGDRIDRSALTALGTQVVQGGADVLEFFAAVMIWGDPLGRGRLHTHAVFHDARLESVLASASNALRSGQLAAAYSEFCPGQPYYLAGCGPAFFTKFLAFFSSALRATGSDVPVALILDGRVEQAMKVLSDKEWKARLRGRSDAEKYVVYVEAATESARQIGCDPDDIEFALFKARSNI